MVYKWNIDIILTGSGVILPCVYEGSESNTEDVFVKIFSNKAANEIIGLNGNNGRSSTFIRVGEIASVDIYPKR